MADPITNEIAGHGRHKEDRTRRPDRHANGAVADEKTDDEKQRVARQKEANQQSALCKNDSCSDPDGKTACIVENLVRLEKRQRARKDGSDQRGEQHVPSIREGSAGFWSS